MEDRHTLHSPDASLPSVLWVIPSLVIFSPDASPNLPIGWESYEAPPSSSNGLYKAVPWLDKRQ